MLGVYYYDRILKYNYFTEQCIFFVVLVIEECKSFTVFYIQGCNFDAWKKYRVPLSSSFNFSGSDLPL